MEPEEITQTLGHRQPGIKKHETKTPKRLVDAQERIQFLKEMEKTREELAEFKKNMNTLIQQMDHMSAVLENSKDRVCLGEIEQDLTITEEVNVNLQVLLERAVKTQRESDVYATQSIRTMCSKLALVVYESNQLQGRLASLESHQKEQEGSVDDISKRMKEYTQMLEQAQGTIHMLQEPRKSCSSSRRTSTASLTDDDNDSTITKKETHIITGYIQSPPLGPQQHKVQHGLRMLFPNQNGLGPLNKRN